MATKLPAQDARSILAAAKGGSAQGKAADIATVKGAVTLDRVVLIGIFGKGGDLAALIRDPNGEIVKVKRGDQAPGGQVVAIAKDRVVLKHGIKTEVLKLPG